MYRFFTFICLFLSVFTSASFAQENKDPKAMYDQIKYLDHKRDEALRNEKDPGKIGWIGFVCSGQVISDTSIGC
jgi:hypothetical protein